MKRVVAGCVAVTIMLACTDDGGPAANADVAGDWNFIELLQEFEFGIVCNDTGTFSFVQNGTTVSGTYSQTGTCQGASSVDNAATGNIVDGSVVGNNLTFSLTACTYEGTVNTEAGIMTGGASCELADSVRVLTFTGDWSASR